MTVISLARTICRGVDGAGHDHSRHSCPPMSRISCALPAESTLPAVGRSESTLPGEACPLPQAAGHGDRQAFCPSAGRPRRSASRWWPRARRSMPERGRHPEEDCAHDVATGRRVLRHPRRCRACSDFSIPRPLRRRAAASDRRDTIRRSTRTGTATLRSAPQRPDPAAPGVVDVCRDVANRAPRNVRDRRRPHIPGAAPRAGRSPRCWCATPEARMPTGLCSWCCLTAGYGCDCGSTGPRAALLI